MFRTKKQERFFFELMGKANFLAEQTESADILYKMSKS
jgi:hypothetical protein